MSHLLDQRLVLELADNVLAVDLLDLSRSVLLDELFDEHVATAYSHEDLIALFNLHVYALGAKLVDTFRFSQEHNLHLFSLGIAINESAQVLVNPIISSRDVNDLMLLELAVQVHELHDFGLGHPKLELQHF